MDTVLALLPYIVAAAVGVFAFLQRAAVKREKGEKVTAHDLVGEIVHGVKAAKASLDEQGVDYRKHLTGFISERVTDPKQRALLEKAIERAEAVVDGGGGE